MKPSDFVYIAFACEKEWSSTGLTVIITDKYLWREEGVWDDSGASSELPEVQASFDCLCDAQFEPTNPTLDTIEKIEAHLDALGFVKDDTLIPDASNPGIRAGDGTLIH